MLILEESLRTIDLKKKSKCLNYSATYLGLNKPEAKISKYAAVGQLLVDLN